MTSEDDAALDAAASSAAAQSSLISVDIACDAVGSVAPACSQQRVVS